MDKIEDTDLGTIYIKRNARAKHVIARRKGESFILTVPICLSNKNIELAFLQLKPKLLSIPRPNIFKFKQGQQDLKTLTFDISIELKNLDSWYYTLNESVLSIIIPKDVDLDTQETQERIKVIVELYLRHEARKLLPTLVKQLAEKHSFTYSSVSIQKSKTRWGSCSFTKKINLSLWCMLLPKYLVEFIILHELCHTIEMNHGSRFWTLLDHVTDGKAKQLTTELKHQKILL